MHMYKPRGLNIDESYACNRTAVRKAFEGQELSVMWGSTRSFSFDFQMRKPPRIDGIVVASLSVNHRMRNPAEHGILNFYVICDSQYGSAQKQAFESICLPRLRRWYDDQLPLRHRGGCDEILVIWNAGSFQFTQIHFV